MQENCEKKQFWEGENGNIIKKMQILKRIFVKKDQKWKKTHRTRCWIASNAMNDVHAG